MLFAVAPVAACGFTPVYRASNSGNSIRGRVDFAPPSNPLAFSLVSRLEDRIGRSNGGPYLLSYGISTSESALAISETDDINRIQIAGTIEYRVTETVTDVQVQAGEVSTFAAYATSGSPVATAAARRDAEDRLMITLADQLVARLLASSASWA